MGKLNWYISRLKAMDYHEIIWRIKQKKLQRQEYKNIYALHLPVTQIPLNKNIRYYKFDYCRMWINNKCFNSIVFDSLDIFNGAFDYRKFKKKWNAGFQTDNTWPEKEFSYSISCSSRVDIGDIRTNWELNRHYQFSALAKSFYLTKNMKYFDELYDLFYDWNQHNLFLHGVEWNSPMEIAIRVNSWCFTLAFLSMVDMKNEKKHIDQLKKDIEYGILVMVDYITRHFSEYSSANNHLILELYAVALGGIVFNNKHWIENSIKRLTEELIRQNYEDGVNKEMSLHYQTFIMEAYGILILLMKSNNIEIPIIWYNYLSKMSEFVSDSCDDGGEVMIFGDNDEGKILNLSGEYFNYYKYILDLMSIILDIKYTYLEDVNENIKWLVSDETLNKSKNKKLYRKDSVKCYKQGGYTFIRDKKRNFFMGIDHADLGFGTLAAHGHADALSFQLFKDGIPVFIDPGTYNYHITPEERKKFRSTGMHNTVSIDNYNQSEMLGPFLWGKKAKCNVIKYPSKDDINLIAKQIGNIPSVHIRNINYTKDGVLCIEDKIKDAKIGIFNLILSPQYKIDNIQNNIIILKNDDKKIKIKLQEECKEIKVENVECSSFYNAKYATKKISINFKEKLNIKIY